MTELAVATAILVMATLPLASSVVWEMRALKACYHHALAMEIVDGEMEVLVAGEWQSFKQGSQLYTVHAESAANLPPGRFLLTLSGKNIRLEWAPEGRVRGASVVREVTFK